MPKKLNFVPQEYYVTTVRNCVTANGAFNKCQINVKSQPKSLQVVQHNIYIYLVHQEFSLELAKLPIHINRGSLAL